MLKFFDILDSSNNRLNESNNKRSLKHSTIDDLKSYKSNDENKHNVSDVELSSLSSDSSPNSLTQSSVSSSYSPFSTCSSSSVTPPMFSNDGLNEMYLNKTTECKTMTEFDNKTLSESSDASLSAMDQSNLKSNDKYSDENLELLFDRLVRLTNPKIAIKMSTILMEHMDPKYVKENENDQYDKTNLSSNKVHNYSNKCAKVVHREPTLIAFDLRKLPDSCLDELVQLITEDEELSRI